MKRTTDLLRRLFNSRRFEYRFPLYIKLLDRLLRWSAWSAATALRLRAAEAEAKTLAEARYRLEQECKFLRAETERLRDDNNWLVQRGFQYESEYMKYHDTCESSLRVHFSTGAAWDRVVMDIKERVRYHAGMNIPDQYLIDCEIRRMAPMIRDSLSAHVMATLGGAIKNRLLEERGAAAIAKQKGPRP